MWRILLGLLLLWTFATAVWSSRAPTAIPHI
jgi:hypothetical protein